jgi:ketosteroid isomerase-like protein
LRELRIVGVTEKRVNAKFEKCAACEVIAERLTCALARRSNSCHDLGVKIISLLVILLAFVLSLFAADCPKNQPRTEAALIEAEQNWAAALNRKDVAAVACLLADVFEDADVDGSLHTRSQTLDHIPNKKPGTNQLSELRAHIEGNIGFTRGLATLVDPSGKVVARVRFTDIFTYRDGRWQALAGQESLLGGASR